MKTINEIDQEIQELQKEKAAIQQANSAKLEAEAAEASLKSRSEIDRLVEAYNQNEIEQEQRLGRLFYLLKRRKGYKRVLFSGDMWSNCWDKPDGLDKELYLGRMSRLIVDVTPGE